MAIAKKSANRYELSQSALYKLPSVKALAVSLLWEECPSALRALSKRKNNFNEYDSLNPLTGKLRHIQAPKPPIKKLQKRIDTLLKQILVPDYLQSGIPKRSYLTNSEIHMRAKGATVTVDISDFYPSITRRRVFRLFRNVFRCVPDVADVLADLVCCSGHLATGSPASAIVSFFACKDMYDLMSRRAQKQGAVFTLYIDDIAMTGDTVGSGDSMYLATTLAQFGFRSKKSKAKVFRKDQAKVVTGRAFRNGVSRAPNRQHLGMRDAICISQIDAQDVKKKRRAVGKIEHVGMLDELRSLALKGQAQDLRSSLPSTPRKARSIEIPPKRDAAIKVDQLSADRLPATAGTPSLAHLSASRRVNSARSEGADMIEPAS